VPSSYDPDPPTSGDARLPDALAPLIEQVAERVHDAWARRRLDEGWTHGPERDDAAKTHPGLVPYDALPEAEKAYDRATARATLRAVLAAGYRLVPPGDAAPAAREALAVARALARGYVAHFAAPVARRLAEGDPPGRLHVWLPRTPAALASGALRAVVEAARAAGFGPVTLPVRPDGGDQDDGPPRDALTVLHDGTSPARWFDVPSTLRTLRPLAEAETEAEGGASGEAQAQALVAAFAEAVRAEAAARGVAEGVVFLEEPSAFLRRDGG
jgi:hypothetical protein